MDHYCRRRRLCKWLLRFGSPTSGSGAAKAWMSDALVNARWKPEADVLAAVRRVAQWKWAGLNDPRHRLRLRHVETSAYHQPLSTSMDVAA